MRSLLAGAAVAICLDDRAAGGCLRTYEAEGNLRGADASSVPLAPLPPDLNASRGR